MTDVDLALAACLFKDRMAYLRAKIEAELDDAIRCDAKAGHFKEEEPVSTVDDTFGNIASFTQLYLRRDATGAALQRDAAAGAALVLLDNVVHALVSDINSAYRDAGLEHPYSYKRTSLVKGPLIRDVHASVLVAAAASGFRHMDEWLALTFDTATGSYVATKDQRASIDPLLKALDRMQISPRVPFDALMLLAGVPTEVPIRGIIQVMRAIAKDVFSSLDQEGAWEAAQSLKRPFSLQYDL